MRNYALGEEEPYEIPGKRGMKKRVKFSGKNTNKEKFFDGLPNKIGDDKKEYFWNKIRKGIDEDLYNPEDKVLDYMRSSEFKAGYSKKYDIEPGYKYRRGGMYTGGGMGYGGMYEDKGGESELHIYDFDDTIAQVKTNIRATITSPKGDYEKVLDIPSDKFPEVSKDMETKFSMMNFDYDFSEFEKEIEGAIISSEVLNKLKSSVSNPSVQTTILTARTEGEPVINFFKKIGLDPYIIPLGSMVSGERVMGQDKADWIEKRIDFKKTIKKVYFIDDSAENRKAVYTLRDNNPEIEFKIETPPPIEEMMGMMNKQEKAKHAKNMKRLSKDMPNMKGDNHGGGGYKVPDYVKGTLTRKLYEFDDNDIRQWANHADLYKILSTPDAEETYSRMKNSLNKKIEKDDENKNAYLQRLEALEYFYGYFKENPTRAITETAVFSQNWWKSAINKILITEGGAAGHMNHPFDDRDLTFAEMKELVHLSLQGKLNIESDVTEKTDGQNLAVTYKNGKVGAARNKASIREPMDINAVASKFEGRGDIEKAFIFSMRDLENALKNLSPKVLNNIFQNGKRFLNIEIIYPSTKNVITYGPKAYIQFHGVDEYNLETATKGNLSLNLHHNYKN